jgi:hypothetical protein
MDIVLTASELKIAAMPQYMAFVKAVEKLEDRLKTDLVAADSNVVFPAQGKAQIVSQLKKKLEDCLTLREGFKRRG